MKRANPHLLTNDCVSGMILTAVCVSTHLILEKLRHRMAGFLAQGPAAVMEQVVNSLNPCVLRTKPGLPVRRGFCSWHPGDPRGMWREFWGSVNLDAKK